MSTKPQTLDEKVRAYFGFGYEGDTEIEQKLTEIKRKKTLKRVLQLFGVVGFVLLFLATLDATNFSLSRIEKQFPEFTAAVGQFFPITHLFGVIPVLDVGTYIDFYWSDTSKATIALPLSEFALLSFAFEYPSIADEGLKTLAMGFAGTVLGIPGALMFGVLGSERVTPFPFNFFFRGIMSTIRSIPALVWALIYIPLGGLTAFTAVLAIGTDTIGNLGRLYTDALEEVKDGPIEAIESTGANRRQTITFGMLSQVFTPFIAWTMYIMEINTRIAVTMGLIGAGGIGNILRRKQRFLNWNDMMATILVVFILVVSVEMVSQRTRSYLREDAENDKGFFAHLWDLIKGFPQRMADSVWK